MEPQEMYGEEVKERGPVTKAVIFTCKAMASFYLIIGIITTFLLIIFALTH